MAVISCVFTTSITEMNETRSLPLLNRDHLGAPLQGWRAAATGIDL